MDKISFEAVYQELFPSVYRFVYLRIPASEVEDVTSEIMAKIWRVMDTFAGKSSLKSWALKITANHIVDFYRGRKNVKFAPLSEEAVNVPSGQCWDDDLATSDVIQKALSRLSESQMAAIQFRLIEGLSAVETADILGVSPQAVDSLLYRAKKSFRQAYEQEVAGGEANG